MRFSSILHPTSSILHPTSSILHPTSYILHPASYIQHPTSYIQHPASYIQHPTSYILSYPKKCKSLQFKDCTPTARPQAVRNRFVTEVFSDLFVFLLWFLDFSVGIRAFVIGLCQISSFFSRYLTRPLPNYERFPWSICDGCDNLAGDAYLPSIFGICICSYCWYYLSPTCHDFPDFHLENPLVLSRHCIQSLQWCIADFNGGFDRKHSLSHGNSHFWFPGIRECQIILV